MSSSLLEILTLMEQVIIAQEARKGEKVVKNVGFSDTEQEVDFTKFNSSKTSGQFDPWGHADNKGVFDQKDLEKVYDLMTTDVNQGKFNSSSKEITRAASGAEVETDVKKYLEPLVIIYEHLPENQREVYLDALSKMIQEILNYWTNPVDRIEKVNKGTTGRQDLKTREDITRMSYLVMGAIIKIASKSKIPSLMEIANRYIQSYESLKAKSEQEMQAGASSITRPQVQTTRLPKNLQDYSALMDTFFEGANDLNSRVNKLKQLADFFASEDLQAEAKKMSNTKFMSYVVMMDYLVEITKSFDAQSGRYLLEYLLAVVSMGQVTGATLGSTGQQDAVDFVEGDNLGSSKFVSSYSDVFQSIAGFESYMKKKITYVVALKEGSPFRLDTTAPEPVEVQQIRVHVFDLVYYSKNNFHVYYDGVQKKTGKDYITNDGKVNIGAMAKGAPSFTIPLAFTTEEGTKTYRQMLETSLGDTKKQLLAIVKDLFDGLKKADEMSRKYVVTGKPDDGGKAINGMRQANEKLLALSSKKEDGTPLFGGEYEPPDINAEN